MRQIIDFIDESYSSNYKQAIKITNTTANKMTIENIIVKYKAYGSATDTIPTIDINFKIVFRGEEELILKKFNKDSQGFLTIEINKTLDVYESITISREENDNNLNLWMLEEDKGKAFILATGGLGCKVTASCSSIIKGSNDLIVPFGIVEESQEHPGPKYEHEDRDWYINTDIHDKPIMWWIKGTGESGDSGNIYVLIDGEFKKGTAYLLANNSFIKVNLKTNLGGVFK